MKHLLLITLTLAISSVAFSQPDPNATGMAFNPTEAVGARPQFTLSTPENSARYFMNALLTNRELDLSLAVSGARVGYYGTDDWEKESAQMYPLYTMKNLTVDKVTVDAQTEDDATVTITAYRQFPNEQGRLVRDGKPIQYELQLRHEMNSLATVGGFDGNTRQWRAVPLSPEEVLAKPLRELPPLQLAAALFLRDPRLMPLIRREHAMSQLKQLGLGVLQFVQDYDTIYAFDDAAHERAILPYIKTNSLYTIAGTKDEKWHFNDNLSSKSLAQIAEPARTVMFYDGSAPDSDHLNFRFEDKTIIGYADGHVSVLAKDKLADLIWKP